MKFEKGNTIGAAGRPKGVKNKLATTVLGDLLKVWDEPIKPDSDITRGIAALRVMSRERPGDFCKLYGALVPREFWVENVVTDASDDEIYQMLERVRDQIREARALELSAPKVIDVIQ